MIREQMCWITEDGMVHLTKGQAQIHETQIDFKSWCRKDSYFGGEFCSDMVSNEILEVWEVKRRVDV